MIELSEATLRALAVHRVGNQSRDEGFISSEETYSLDSEMERLLLEYFLTPFQPKDYYKLSHEEDLQQNRVYRACSQVFEEPDKLLESSIEILKHLYNQSSHPHIKAGEVFVARFDDIILEGEVVEAIGVFKAETLSRFIQMYPENGNFVLSIDKGILIKKLDKGCLIFNTEKDSGFRVLTVDQNFYDAQYWQNDFLTLAPDQNESFFTKNMMSMVKEFADEVPELKEDKTKQSAFLSKSVEYFDSNDQFNMGEFAEQVLPVPELGNEFQSFQKQYKEDKGLPPEIETFDIAPDTVKTMRNKLKTNIKLDNNIQIKLDFYNPESSQEFIEKGYDDSRGMHFYKVYFNEEKN